MIKTQKFSTDRESSAKKGVDFRSVLMNSKAEVEKQKKEFATKGLAASKDYEEFLEQLNKQTEKLRAPKNKLDKDDFLKLFVTQLQNQDPLKPKDGAEMASQLAQFNSLEQMLNINKGIESLAAAQNKQHMTDFVNFVGKDIVLSDNRIAFSGTDHNSFTIDTDASVPGAQVKISDATGQEISRFAIGELGVGTHKLDWDGKDKDGHSVAKGTYKVEIYDAENNVAPVKYKSIVTVTGMKLGDEPKFRSQIGLVEFDNISDIGSQESLMQGVESKISNRAQQPKSANVRKAEGTP